MNRKQDVMTKWAAAERLRSAKAREAAEAVVAQREHAAFVDGRRIGLRVGRAEASAQTKLPSAFVEDVMRHVAREFAHMVAVKLHGEVPGPVAAEVALEVWKQFERGAVNMDNLQSYVRFTLEERGDVRLDITFPEMRFCHTEDRHAILARRYR